MLRLIIPSKKQFNRWTILKRVAYLASLVAVIGFAIKILTWSYGVYTWFQPAPANLSPADLLIIDQNPTSVEITNISIESLGTGSEAVFLTLTNNSSVTARNVQVYLYNHLGAKLAVAEPFANGYKGGGMDIAANMNRRYKIGSLQEYERSFNLKDPNARLLRVSTQPQDLQPFELQALACGYKQGRIRPCAFGLVDRSTLVDLRYGSIFGQKYAALTQFYNTFLQGKVEYLPDLSFESRPN